MICKSGRNCAQLRLPPQAAGADARAAAAISPASRRRAKPGIARIFALEHGRDWQTARNFRRHVLHAVHRQIHAPSSSASSSSLVKIPFHAQFARLGAVANLVAGRLDHHNFRSHAAAILPALRARDSPARAPARCRACQCAAASLLLLVQPEQMAQRFESGSRPRMPRPCFSRLFAADPAGARSTLRSCARCGRALAAKLRHVFQLFANQRFALLVKLVAQVADDRPRLERTAARLQICRCARR